jgi:hypothetical protein
LGKAEVLIGRGGDGDDVASDAGVPEVAGASVLITTIDARTPEKVPK